MLFIGGGGATSQYGGPASSYDGVLETTAWSGSDGSAGSFAYSTAASNSARGGGGSLTVGGDNSPTTCSTAKPSGQYKGADGTSPTVCNGGGGKCYLLCHNSELLQC